MTEEGFVLNQDSEIVIPPGPTHDWVAKKIGYSISGVSLIRNGNRRPTIHTMSTIERAFGWSIEDQVESWRADTYKKDFNSMIAQKYEEETKENIQ